MANLGSNSRQNVRMLYVPQLLACDCLRLDHTVLSVLLRGTLGSGARPVRQGHPKEG